MKKALILIGLPRSGKSTFANEFKKKGYFVLNKDSLRLQLYNKRFWDKGEYQVTYASNILLDYVINQEINIIVDETNINLYTRTELIKKLINNGYEVSKVFFETSVMECMERARLTNQEDLIPVIKKMSENLSLGEDIETEEYYINDSEELHDIASIIIQKWEEN